MNELPQMAATLLFLPLLAVLIYYGLAALRSLASGLRSGEARLQRNGVYLLALCLIAGYWLYWFWFWLMWQMD